MKRAVTAGLLTAALVVPVVLPRAHAADVPRYRLSIPAGVAAHDPGGAVQFIGTATLLLRVRGLAVLIDPGADADPLPPADLVVLTQANAGNGGAVAPAWGMLPVLAVSNAAQQLRTLGFHSVYPLDTWDTLTVRKGDTRLRVTSLPDTHGRHPRSMALMLDFGPACRVFLHGDVLQAAEIESIPQRYPGARLALLRDAGAPMLMTVAENGREAAIERGLKRGHAYRFGTPSCR